MVKIHIPREFVTRRKKRKHVFLWEIITLEKTPRGKQQPGNVVQHIFKLKSVSNLL